MKRHFLNIFAVLACALSGAFAQSAAPVEESVTVITSERLTFDYQRQFALFEGNVVVVDPQMRILADKMTVLFDEGNKAKSIKAEGEVYIIQEEKKAKAEKADYDVATGTIVLTGKPQITQGKDVVTGETITFFKNEDRVLVDGRSKLVIFPKDGEKKNPLFDLGGGK